MGSGIALSESSRQQIARNDRYVFANFLIAATGDWDALRIPHVHPRHRASRPDAYRARPSVAGVLTVQSESDVNRDALQFLHSVGAGLTSAQRSARLAGLLSPDGAWS